MVSFELGKEIKKDFFSSCQERGTKKKISESPSASESPSQLFHKLEEPTISCFL